MNRRWPATFEGIRFACLVIGATTGICVLFAIAAGEDDLGLLPWLATGVGGLVIAFGLGADVVMKVGRLKHRRWIRKRYPDLAVRGDPEHADHEHSDPKAPTTGHS